MKNYIRFKFVKELVKSDNERIPVDSELTVLNDTIYFNGGMITPVNYYYFKKLIEDEMKNPNYLKEIPIPVNKL